MLSVFNYFGKQQSTISKEVKLKLNFYSLDDLIVLKEKARELKIKVPKCLEFPSQDLSINQSSYTTYSRFYALDLPVGMSKTVRDYVLNDLFKDQSSIVFSSEFMTRNGLTLVEDNVRDLGSVHTHYIDYKGIRFYLNLYHLDNDLTLENNHIILNLAESRETNKHNYIRLMTTKCARLEQKSQEKREAFKTLIDSIHASSDEVESMIQEIVNVFDQKKRLIIAPENFNNQWFYKWQCIATAEEINTHTDTTYADLARYFADLLPNSQLMYATSAYGLVSRYEHIKSYDVTVSKSYCGNAELSKLRLMSHAEAKAWAKRINEQIQQITTNQNIDEVHFYLYKSYLKSITMHGNYHVPLKDFNHQMFVTGLKSKLNIVELFDYIDPQFFANCK